MREKTRPVKDLRKLFAAPFKAPEGIEYKLRLTLRRGYLGVGEDDRPVLVVPLAASGLPAGRVLGSVRLAFRHSMRFSIDGREWQQQAGVVECLDAGLLSTFCVFAQDVDHKLEGDPTPAGELLGAVEAWDHLLRRRPALRPDAEIGLWGELTVLSWCPDLDRGVIAWTGPSGAVADFMGGGVALEVKTTTDRLKHHVSLAQSEHDGANLESSLASLWVMKSDEGHTLPEVCDRLEDAIQDQAAFRSRLLAAGYSELDRDQYDTRYVLADEPWVFPMSQVPRVREVDAGVLHVRYTIDLSSRVGGRKREIVASLAQACEAYD